VGTMRTWEMVGRLTRPAWAGPVTISDNRPGDDVIVPANPRTVMGIVVPVSTAGRGNAPKPFSGSPTGKAQGTDKGHMMALELGGPDISQNISPQSNLWQQSGGWRAIEVVVLRFAMECMGFTSTYDPAKAIAQPQRAIFFRVAPLGIDSNGEPSHYEGVAVPVSPRGNGDYDPIRDAAQRIWLIQPGGYWCNRDGTPAL
jgi:hypothetical protein